MVLIQNIRKVLLEFVKKEGNVSFTVKFESNTMLVCLDFNCIVAWFHVLRTLFHLLFSKPDRLPLKFERNFYKPEIYLTV